MNRICKLITIFFVFVMIIVIVLYTKGRFNHKGKERTADRQPVLTSAAPVKADVSNIDTIVIAPSDATICTVVPTNVGWNAENVAHWLRVLGTPFDADMTGVIVATALAAHTTVASNAVDFIRELYYLPFTNDAQVGAIGEIIWNTTNVECADGLFALWTNAQGRTFTLPESGNNLDGAYCLLKPLRTMGTPEIIDKINKGWLDLKKKGVFSGLPSETISPDAYPKEARDWLFHYPITAVRDAMANTWYWSERPEAAQVLRDYIKRLKATSINDSYWDAPEPRDSYKRARIKEIQNLADNYERQYQRWLEDKQRMPLHSGLYEDNGWDDYRQLSEQERRNRYGAQYESRKSLNRQQ